MGIEAVFAATAIIEISTLGFLFHIQPFSTVAYAVQAK